MSTLDFNLKKGFRFLTSHPDNPYLWNVLSLFMLHKNPRGRCGPGMDLIADEACRGNKTKATFAKYWLIKHDAIKLVPYDKRVYEETKLPVKSHLYQLTGFFRTDDGEVIPYMYLQEEDRQAFMEIASELDKEVINQIDDRLNKKAKNNSPDHAEKMSSNDIQKKIRSNKNQNDVQSNSPSDVQHVENIENDADVLNGMNIDVQHVENINPQHGENIDVLNGENVSIYRNIYIKDQESFRQNLDDSDNARNDVPSLSAEPERSTRIAYAQQNSSPREGNSSNRFRDENRSKNSNQNPPNRNSNLDLELEDSEESYQERGPRNPYTPRRPAIKSSNGQDVQLSQSVKPLIVSDSQTPEPKTKVTTTTTKVQKLDDVTVPVTTENGNNGQNGQNEDKGKNTKKPRKPRKQSAEAEVVVPNPDFAAVQRAIMELWPGKNYAYGWAGKMANMMLGRSKKSDQTYFAYQFVEPVTPDEVYDFAAWCNKHKRDKKTGQPMPLAETAEVLEKWFSEFRTSVRGQTRKAYTSTAEMSEVDLTHWR